MWVRPTVRTLALCLMALADATAAWGREEKGARGDQREGRRAPILLLLYGL